MNIDWSIESFILISIILFSFIGSYFIIKINWKRYGLLFITSGIVGVILCFLFVFLGFYSFSYTLLPYVPIPILAIITFFPFLVLCGVRYSPKSWVWKIPFYWGIIHLGMLGETTIIIQTNLIEYQFKWDFWDSYTWWWIYYLAFEWVGGKLVPSTSKKPISAELFKYGQPAWFIFHFIVVITIFLAGVYLGKLL